MTAPRPDSATFDAELTGRVMNLGLLRRLFGWLAPYRVALLASAVLVLLASVLQVLLPVILALVVVDHVIMGAAVGPDDAAWPLVQASDQLARLLGVGPLLGAAALYVLVQLAWAAVGHGHRLTLNGAVLKALRDLRLDLFAHLERRPFSFYDKVAVGRVTTRVTNDVEALYDLLRGFGTLVGEFVPFFVALGLMLAVNVELTLMLLLALPVLGLVSLLFRRATRTLFRKVRLSVSSLNQNLQENLAGLTVVQLSGREEANLATYGALNRSNLGLELQSTRLETLYGAFTDSMSGLALALILWFGGTAVLGQDPVGPGGSVMTLGGIILFTRFVDMLFQPIVALGEQTNILFRAMASGERIFQALDWDEQVHEPAVPVTLPDRLAGHLQIHDLDFSYQSGPPVLRGINLDLPAGEQLAIVGPTGSGKSTLIRLLGRFYDIPDGRIMLDGIDVNAIASADLRRRIGVVLQDFHIFSGSVHDNIALGDPRITREQVRAAARTVHADSFIEALPRGYDSPLAERGQNLSQGQRQLLAFARVLAADPEILVLDEATASIDTHTEQLIQAALAKLTAGRTSIIIAHRLQTIQNCQRIMVLADGAVAELGSHAELLAAEGLYAELHALQFQAPASADHPAAAS